MKKVKGYKVSERENTIKVNGNECFEDIGKEVLDRFKEALDKICFNRYPENTSKSLREKYGEYLGLEKENVIVGNGSDAMIDLVIRAYITKGKKVLTLSPDFSMYDFYVEGNEGKLIKLKTNEDGSFKIEDFINLGKKEDVNLIIFSNPNNPTGYGKRKEEVLKIVENFKDKIVLVDEAYIEFYDESVVNMVNKYKNLLVTRTLSKAFSGAAIRVGFLLGNKDIVEKLNEYKVPFNVNTISQKFAEVLIEKKDKMIELKNITLAERERVYKELKNIQVLGKEKVKFYKSNGNFIFGRGNKGFLKSFFEAGIQIRDFNNDTFRITIGSEEENNKVLKLLREFVIND